MTWASPPCARSPRRPRSNPTPSCAWRAGGLSKATRISARPFREAIRQGAVSFPDRARWLQDHPPRGAISAGSMPTWSKGAIRNIEETFAGIDADTLKPRPRRSGPRAGLHARRRRQQLQCRNFTYLASTGMVEFHAIPRPAGRHRRSGLGRRARRPDRDDLQTLPHRGGRGRRIAREQGVTVIGLRQPRQPDHPRRRVTASSSASTRRSSSRPRSRPSPFWKRC
jgi:hypothetical protein